MMNVKRILAGCLVSLAALMTTGCDLLEAKPPELSEIPTVDLIEELIRRGENVFDDDE